MHNIKYIASTSVLLLILDNTTSGGQEAHMDGPLLERLWMAIGVPSRLAKIQNVTITGTVVGAKPHITSDGDMVFALKPDEPYKEIVNIHNMSQSKMANGIWVEAVCQGPNQSQQSWHVGDCAKGGPFPKFPLPNLGDRLRITGTYAIDIREGGHAEIHPVSRITKI